jgi:hypothetical protein
MKNPRKILRPKAAYEKCGCGKTKFDEDYRHRDDGDPHVPGTQVKRVRPVNLGPRNIGYFEHELDELLDGLRKVGGHSESKAKNEKAARTTRVLLADRRR